MRVEERERRLRSWLCFLMALLCYDLFLLTHCNCCVFNLSDSYKNQIWCSNLIPLCILWYHVVSYIDRMRREEERRQDKISEFKSLYLALHNIPSYQVIKHPLSQYLIIKCHSSGLVEQPSELEVVDILQLIDWMEYYREQMCAFGFDELKCLARFTVIAEDLLRLGLCWDDGFRCYVLCITCIQTVPLSAPLFRPPHSIYDSLLSSHHIIP